MIERRNFILHVLNGVLFAVSEAFTDPNLVVTALLSQLTTSNVLIGLLAPLRDTGWFLPQLFISPWIERMPRKARFYAKITVVRGAGWVALCTILFTLTQPQALLAAFFGCMLLISLAAGFAGLPFMTVTQKVIPHRRMGLLFGLRQFIGGGLGILVSGTIGVILAGNAFGLHLAFPGNYGLLFVIGTAFFFVASTSFGLIKEEPDPIPNRITPLGTQLRRAREVFASNVRFRNFFFLRVALMFGMTCIPFMTVFARRVLGASDAYLGSLVPVTLSASLLSNLAWARITDRIGSRWVLTVCAVLGSGLCGIVLVIVLVTSTGSTPWVLLPLTYALGGAISSGIGGATTPQIIEIVPHGQGPLYFGLLNTLLGVVMLCTSLVGLIADNVSYGALFAFCGLCFAVALERTRMLHHSSVEANGP